VTPAAAALTGPFLAAVGVLGTAGTLKLARPDGAVRALAAASLPADRRVVRVLGSAELAIAIAAVTVPGRVTAALVFFMYLLFAAYVVLLARRGGDTGCGCFGVEDQAPPVVPLHVAVTGAAAALAAATSIVGGPLSVRALLDQPLGGAPLVALAAVCAYLVYLTLAVVPDLVAAVRGGEITGSRA
jgi:hypothetical protein